MTAHVAATSRDAGHELLRMLATLAWVCAGAVAVLGALGAMPALLGGEERDVRAVASIGDAERRLGVRLAVPGYFPARLAWPPSEVRVAGRVGGSAAMTFRAVDGGSPVELIQAAPGAAIDPALLRAPREVTSHPTAIGDVRGRLARVIVDGESLDELRFEVRGRPVVLRSRGSVDELYRMARTARVEGGP